MLALALFLPAVVNGSIGVVAGAAAPGQAVWIQILARVIERLRVAVRGRVVLVDRGSRLIQDVWLLLNQSGGVLQKFAM